MQGKCRTPPQRDARRDGPSVAGTCPAMTDSVRPWRAEHHPYAKRSSHIKEQVAINMPDLFNIVNIQVRRGRGARGRVTRGKPASIFPASLRPDCPAPDPARAARPHG